MPPTTSTQTLLSPAELSFLHSSLLLTLPIRPDLRTPTQFRPLIAETDVLPSTNGSARICFSDGTEAIVGVKAEVEKSQRTWRSPQLDSGADEAGDDDADGDEGAGKQPLQNQGRTSDRWLDVSVEIPAFRDDDNLPIFLSSMLAETLLASASLQSKLFINERWHWKLYVDILLLSAPLSYPLPLLSLTAHLALLHTALPRVTSEPADDPLFDDDWDAAVPLFASSDSGTYEERPPVTLLVMTVGENIIFDPSKDELAVADSVLAISFASSSANTTNGLKLLAIRTIDPPSRLTPPGIPNSLNPATNTGAASLNTGPGGTNAGSNAIAPATAPQQQISQEAMVEKEGGNVWSPPRGGIKRALVARVIKMVLDKGGVGEEVLEGLAGVTG